MANIGNVDYRAIPGQANSMREKGRELNSELTNAYKSIGDMHNSWYGVRYNDLVKSFNKIIPDLNEMLKLVVTDVPFSLETVANNYAQADTGAKVASATQEAANKIVELPTPADVGMKFLTGPVEEVQNNVSNNFKNAKDKMDQIEVTFGQIAWESEAATTYKARFKSLKDKIVTSLDSLNADFTSLMNQAKEDIQATENANTVQ